MLRILFAAIAAIIVTASASVHGMTVHPAALLKLARQQSLSPPPPPPPSDQERLTFWFDQRQDHYDGLNSVTFKQRYFVNATFFHGDGPVFLCVGGEGPAFQPTVVVTGGVHCSLMITLAEQHRALIVAIEHRYYGPSHPTSDISTPNLRFLSSQQATADIAAIHAHIVSEYKLGARNRWVAFGGSYPGMMAAWVRVKFPNLIYAAVSSSSPVFAEVDMQGYNDVVGESMSAPIVGGSKQCFDYIVSGYKAVGSKMTTTSGRAQVAKDFNVCSSSSGANPLDTPLNANQFLQALYDFYPVQGNDPACTTELCNIEKVCNWIIDSNRKTGDSYQSLMALNAATNGVGGACIDADFDDAVAGMSNTTWSQSAWTRVWFYQTCAQFAFYQTCETDSKCPFTTNIGGKPFNDVAMWSQMCARVFGADAKLVQANVDYTNNFYGGRNPSSSRLVFVNGQIDPWHANSVLKAESPGISTIWVPGASHHAWTHPVRSTDRKTIITARLQIGAMVAKWLSESEE